MKTFAWFVIVSLTAAGCTQKQAPVASPSGEQAGYADRYPARLAGARARFADDESKARSSLGEFKAYPDALRNTNYARVGEVIEQADESGRSSAYSEAALESEVVVRFFDEEKDGLRQKVGGAVNYTAKEKQCSEDLGGVAVFAMERGVDKQLEERLRAHNEAQRLIEDYQDELGRANLEPLAKQADKVARTSNVAHVRLELYRREIEALLADASSVRSTLQRTIKDSDAVAADTGASKNKKALAQKRKSQAQAASEKLDSEVEQAKRSVEDMKQRQTTLRNEYDAALDALLADLKSRAEKK